MTATFTTSRDLANFGTRQRAPQNRPLGRTIEVVMRVARTLWPRKAAAELVAITGTSQGNAERWLVGDRGISADHLAELLRSEHGREFLVALMADANPEWWQQAQQAFRIGWMRRQKQELEEAIRAAESIGSSIARAETALRFPDADAHRTQADVVRRTAGVGNRAVAQAGRRR